VAASENQSILTFHHQISNLIKCLNTSHLPKIRINCYKELVSSHLRKSLFDRQLLKNHGNLDVEIWFFSAYHLNHFEIDG